MLIRSRVARAIAFALSSNLALMSAPVTSVTACGPTSVVDDCAIDAPSCNDDRRDAAPTSQDAGFGFGLGLFHRTQPQTFQGARVENFSASNYLSATTGPALGPNKSIVALLYIATIPGASDKEFWNFIDNARSGGWEMNVHNGTVVQIVYAGAGGGLANTTHQVLTVGYHVVVFWQDNAGNTFFCIDGATPETQAAPTYNAPPGGAPHKIGLATDGGSFPFDMGGVVRLVALNRAPSSTAEAQSWGTMGQDNALALPSALTSDANVVFDWYAARDWDGVSGTSVSGGSSPVTFTVNGSPTKTAITEQANLSVLGNFQSTTALDTVKTIGGLPRASCFATYKFVTSDTIVGLEMISTEFSLYPTYASLAVFSNGVYQGQVFALIQSARCMQWIVLPAGAGKTITVVMGSQSTPDHGVTVQGTQLRSVHTTIGGYADVSPVAPNNAMVHYGHSIPAGGNVAIAGRDSYPCLVRNDFNGNSLLEAWGSRRAFDDSIGDDSATNIGGGIVGATGNGVSPIVLQTSTAHGLLTGATVGITNVGGNTAAIGNWTITVVDSTHFSLNGSTGNGAYTSGGVIFAGGGVSTTTGSGVLIQITTKTAHGLSTGAVVDIANVLGNTAANGSWVITVVDATHFTLNGSTGNGTYIGGGYIFTVVAKLVAAAQFVQPGGNKYILFDIGTNDYFLAGGQSATNFGFCMAAMFDAIHARDAAIKCFVFSPQTRYAPASETERSGGWGNLTSYRTNEKLAVSTRLAWCSYYNGAICDGYTSADVDPTDGVHPIESGHTKRWTAIANILYRPLLATNLFARLQVSTASVTSGHVTAINDSSGSGDAGRNFTASGTPPYTANDTEGDVYPAPATWTANTNGDFLDSGTFSVALGQPCWVVHVGRTAQTTAYEAYYENNTAGAGELGYYGTNNTVTGGDLYSGATGDHRAAAVESTLCIMAEVWNGASGAFYVQDAVTPKASSQNTGVLTFTKMRIGSDNGNVDRQKGKNGDYAIYTGVPSASDLAKVWAYLAVHAGVPYSY